MERTKKQSQIGGISIISFIVIVTISLAYYQFVFTPAMNAKPEVAAEVLNPPGSTEISIAEGSSQPSNPIFFTPKEVRATLGESNKVIWTNHDVTAHSVTTDDNYVDPTNGRFDTLSTIGLIPPQGTFDFTFTQEGDYLYHCEPHPWMTGKVSVTESFS
ncbi:MAG: plastocyanin/azurin family copper-binding protein [Candidatus Nitrosocosmicus sp.]|uniref:cupredoxin domain-containing protein n=1 Tax=Candidatus Nitrosocosmicus agrestis TaxID=2563600 RepID=UPI001E5034F3|nr:plastocyanin/azurin family copper-binding protein [Candidatus Nitrosocosmicus sp. SS]MDR4491907.1 plastocyanin/azurin family copper-binding protein [Candidatus Nitrosocosmicus sp.]HET6590465.1 plastocyanin/azurin family copper-binding protein [Candidatus Nitrosocosmicus sp.]